MTGGDSIRLEGACMHAGTHSIKGSGPVHAWHLHARLLPLPAACACSTLRLQLCPSSCAFAAMALAIIIAFNQLLNALFPHPN